MPAYSIENVHRVAAEEPESEKRDYFHAVALADARLAQANMASTAHYPARAIELVAPHQTGGAEIAVTFYYSLWTFSNNVEWEGVQEHLQTTTLRTAVHTCEARRSLMQMIEERACFLAPASASAPRN